MVIVFSCNKTYFVLAGKTPELQRSLVDEFHLTKKDSWDLDDKRDPFQIAFAVRDFNKNDFKADPKRVEWLVNVYEGDSKKTNTV